MSRAHVAIAAAAVLLASSTVAVSSRSSGRDDTRIEELDTHIQARFSKADTRFGFARIATGDQHLVIRRFQPENWAETQTVASLEREGLGVVIYLAGRRLLTTPAALVLAAPSSASSRIGVLPDLRRVLQGPVIVSPVAVRDPLAQPPHFEDLLDEARRAFALFTDGAAAHRFSRGSWSFLARPVRAGTTTCLRCHRSQQDGSALTIGDVLGVVFYGQRRIARR